MLFDPVELFVTKNFDDISSKKVKYYCRRFSKSKEKIIGTEDFLVNIQTTNMFTRISVNNSHAFMHDRTSSKNDHSNRQQDVAKYQKCVQVKKTK